MLCASTTRKTSSWSASLRNIWLSVAAFCDAARGRAHRPALQVALQGLSGLESISDLGPITALDPQKGFGLSRADLTEGTVSIQNRNVRKDAKGQVYYEWCVLARFADRASPVFDFATLQQRW